jgi:choline dehydrogenase
MLSGIGPEDQLQRFGIPALCHLPGVGQNLWNHLSAQTTFKVKDGISLPAHHDAVHFALHYTAPGSSAINDMVPRTSAVVDERQEHVPGIRTRYLTGDVPPEQAARISCTLGLPDGAGYVGPASADPKVQPSFNYCYLRHPNDIRRVGKACDWRRDCWGPRRTTTWPITGSTPPMIFWPTTTLWTSGSAKPWAPPGTYPAPVR